MSEREVHPCEVCGTETDWAGLIVDDVTHRLCSEACQHDFIVEMTGPHPEMNPKAEG